MAIERNELIKSGTCLGDGKVKCVIPGVGSGEGRRNLWRVTVAQEIHSFLGESFSWLLTGAPGTLSIMFYNVAGVGDCGKKNQVFFLQGGWRKM